MSVLTTPTLIRGRCVVAGRAEGEALVTTQTISGWGGITAFDGTEHFSLAGCEYPSNDCHCIDIYGSPGMDGRRTGQHFTDGRTVAGRHQLDGVFGQARGAQAVDQAGMDGGRGMKALRAAAQHHRIARFQA